MQASEILAELSKLGSDSYKRTLMRHGVCEPCFGAKIADMKQVVKGIKRDYQLALDLYDTGVYDAMYLAGLIADDAKMTKKDLKHWLARANCRGLAAWTVAWVAAGSPHGWSLGTEWIGSKKELTQIAGWSTLAGWVSMRPDAELDLDVLKDWIGRIQKTIHHHPDRVGYHMNGFLISLGCYVAPLTATVLATAKKIGVFEADLGDNDCKVPDITESIQKVQARGAIGKKRKTIKC